MTKEYVEDLEKQLSGAKLLLSALVLSNNGLVYYDWAMQKVTGEERIAMNKIEEVGMTVLTFSHSEEE